MVRVSRRVAAGCLALCLTAAAGLARPQAPLESAVKAAYLYKFATFVEWPEGSFARPDSVLQIGVAGNDALAEHLARTVGGRSVNGHAVAIRKVRRGESTAGLHILFVGVQDRATIGDYLQAARGQSVLTVTDTDEALALGSMVNFVVDGQRLRFEVALENVATSRLRISARMLAAALRVEGAS
ncbi:YfiR family protein [Massilia sp. GCM10020059]|uniref:YfiR family protein n=1 Tax=Massilia agrisoli TaxID=2892444 RepID=A0ABS8IX41_9BURK|nr:YfiR family protein [Massilia agrisoli]MCC6073192.1 YfiR family protein [Massilia agrisoli]